MGQLLLDTANLRDIEDFSATSAIAGVTTNPSLMAKEEKGDYLTRLIAIRDVLRANRPEDRKCHLSVEVTTLDPEKMFFQACELHEKLACDLEVHIKIPVMVETLDIITSLSSVGVPVNATACMTAMQAKIASDAGAAIVSFFYNRIKDSDRNPTFELQRYNLLQHGNYDAARVICGSIRQPDDVIACLSNDVEFVTVSPAILEKMVFDPQTDSAIKKFQEDIDRWHS